MSIDNRYKLTIVSNKSSWVSEYVAKLECYFKQLGHYVSHVFDINDVECGDFAFYLSCEQIAGKGILSRNKHNLVVHPSGLPHGRGWSPLAWQILEGADSIIVTLFEATEKVDRGDIYLQHPVQFRGNELIDELHKTQGEVSINLCLKFVEEYPRILLQRRKQLGVASYYSRRCPKDNELNIDKSLREQFNLFRIADNEKYPAHFTLDGQTYILKIYREEESE